MKDKGYDVIPLKERLENLPPRSLDYDLIIHCAGALRHRTDDLYRSNILGTDTLLKSIKNPTCRILYLSSRAVYAPSASPLREDSGVLFPFSDNMCSTGPGQKHPDYYGVTKLTAEYLVSQSGFPFAVIRPTNIYGLGVENMSICLPAKILHNILLGREITLYTPDRLQDYLYVWDLAYIIEQIAHQMITGTCRPGLILNAAAPPSSLHQFIQGLISIAEREWHVKALCAFQEGPAARNAIVCNELAGSIIPGITYTEPEAVFHKMVRYVSENQRT